MTRGWTRAVAGSDRNSLMVIGGCFCLTFVASVASTGGATGHGFRGLLLDHRSAQVPPWRWIHPPFAFFRCAYNCQQEAPRPFLGRPGDGSDARHTWATRERFGLMVIRVITNIRKLYVLCLKSFTVDGGAIPHLVELMSHLPVLPDHAIL